MTEKDLLQKLSESIKKTTDIKKELFKEMGVKRGLRNDDGSGVLTGLTRVGDVVGYEKKPEGGLKAIPGKLLYRGIDVEDLVHSIQSENRLGFEETAYLLLSGSLPNEEELELFRKLIMKTMPLDHRTTMSILSLKGDNIMNILARSVLELYIYDKNPDISRKTISFANR